MRKTKDQKALEKLDSVLNTFMEEVRDVIHYKLNDSINVEDILNLDDKFVLRTVLGWVQRMQFETISDELGPNEVAFVFDNAFYQICSQHIGPEDFSTKAKPYK